MSEIINIPVKEVDGERWLFFMHLFPKATVRAIGMAKKPKRIQDIGHHHCFEIDVEGNIRMKPKKWPVF